MKQMGVAALGTDGKSIIVLSVDREWGERKAHTRRNKKRKEYILGSQKVTKGT